MDDRLYRSPDDRMLAGVAGGLAERLDVDPSIVRIVWAVLIVLTGGLALLVYVVMAIVVPVRDEGVGAPTSGSGSHAAGSTAAWGASTGPAAASPGTAATPRPRPRSDPADRARVGFIGGLVLIGIGALFLVRELIPAFDFDLLWPAMLIGLGIVLVVVALAPNRRSG